MKKIGIIGAGVMGRGVAQCLCENKNKYEIYLYDISNEKTSDAIRVIEKSIQVRKIFDTDYSADEHAMEKIHQLSSIYDMKDMDLIIENVTESFTIKKEVYIKLDECCKEDCIFMVNTSCISITKIAALTKRADKVIGTHFMNPVSLIKGVEVIKGYYTSEETIQKILCFLEALGKESIVVNDYPGFVSNRISHLMMNEAAFIIQEGVASPEQIDDIFKKCYSHKLGPLETADLIGIDTVVNSLDVLYESYHDDKFRCCPLLRKMVDAGLYGRKSGNGFYKY